MEDTLRVRQDTPSAFVRKVLILVLMEDTLRVAGFVLAIDYPSLNREFNKQVQIYLISS